MDQNRSWLWLWNGRRKSRRVIRMQETIFLYDRQKTAIIYKEKEYSYREMIEGIKYYSTLLDLIPEDRVMVCLENRPESMMTLFSIWENKGISVNVDATSSVEQLVYFLQDANPKYIYASNKNYKTVEEALQKSALECQCINVDDIIIPKDFLVEDYTVRVEDETKTAVMLYTSGTTGNPKGVMLSYENIMENIRGVKAVNLVTEEDRLLAVLPYHHIMPLSFTMVMPLHFGVLTVMLDDLSSEGLKRALKKYQITVIIGVPRLWEVMGKSISKQIQTSSLASKIFSLAQKISSQSIRKFIFGKVHRELGGHIRIMVSGGAKLDPEVGAIFETLGFHMIQGYGLTETAPIVSFNVPGRERQDSVGEIIPNVEVKFLEDGEILVRGKNLMQGYYKKPEETAKVIDEEGWFHTGDLGRMEGKHLFIVGRKKDMIVLANGKNINPSDIESQLYKLTDYIQDIAVIEYEKKLVAIVYPDFDLMKARQIHNIQETLKWDIVDKYNVNAPSYQKIHDIKILREELPKTKMGKIRRFLLPELLKKEEGKAPEQKQEREKIEVPSSLLHEYEGIQKYLEEAKGEKVYPDSHLELDLSLDSLDIIEFITFLEGNFGVKLSESDFVDLKTPLDVAKLVKQQGGELQQKDTSWKKILEESDEVALPKSAFYGKIAHLLLSPLLSILFKIQIHHREKLQHEGAAIYIANHQSFLDVPMINKALSLQQIGDLFYIATIIHFRGKFKGYLCNHGNVVLVDVNKNLKNTLKAAGKILKSNKKLMIFPEGARTRDGKLQDFKKTYAILAKELEIPIVPMVVKGAYEAMPFGSSKPKWGSSMSLTVLDAIESKGKTVEEIIEETKLAIARELGEVSK